MIHAPFVHVVARYHRPPFMDLLYYHLASGHPRSHLIFTLSLPSHHLVTPPVFHPVSNTNAVHWKHGPTSERSRVAGDCEVNILPRGAVQRPIGFSHRPGDTSRQRGIQYRTNCGEYARRCARIERRHQVFRSCLSLRTCIRN